MELLGGTDYEHVAVIAETRKGGGREEYALGSLARAPGVELRLGVARACQAVRPASVEAEHKRDKQ